MLPRRALLAAALAPGAGLAQEAPLLLLSEDFPPINFEDQGEASGLAGELVLAMLLDMGLQLKVHFMPWARAYRIAQSPQPVCLFTMARTRQRERLFQWVGPVVEFQNALIGRAGTDRIRSIELARRAPEILTVRDWSSEQELKQLGFRNLKSVSNGTVALRMLLANRAALMATERALLPDLLRREGLDESAIATLLVYSSNPGYLAFSLATPKAVIRRWQASLDRLRASGEFERISRRWLPHMLPPG
jgi:polar amino acid transport system substrate-binding protein